MDPALLSTPVWALAPIFRVEALSFRGSSISGLSWTGNPELFFAHPSGS